MIGGSNVAVSTVSLTGLLSLPAGSVWVAVITDPSAGTGCSEVPQLPSGSTKAVPISVLDASLTETMAPGSPLPNAADPSVGFIMGSLGVPGT